MAEDSRQSILSPTSRIGNRAEAYCARVLLDQGYTILARQYTWQGIGEIDLVACKGRNLYFIEVKARRDFGRYGGPAATISEAKRRRIRKLVVRFCQERQMFDYNCYVLGAFVELSASSNPSSCIFEEIW